MIGTWSVSGSARHDDAGGVHAGLADQALQALRQYP